MDLLFTLCVLLLGVNVKGKCTSAQVVVKILLIKCGTRELFYVCSCIRTLYRKLKLNAQLFYFISSNEKIYNDANFDT